jgi:hypothetical protein
VFALGAFERVQVGPAGADVAVSGDELLHLHALAAEIGVGARGNDHAGATLLGALCKGVDDRQVGDVSGIRAVGGRNVLQGVEVGTPGIDTLPGFSR